MPAATSHEDLHQTMSSASSLSSLFEDDFVLFMDSANGSQRNRRRQQQQQQQASSVGCLSSQAPPMSCRLQEQNVNKQFQIRHHNWRPSQRDQNTQHRQHQNQQHHQQPYLTCPISLNKKQLAANDHGPLSDLALEPIMLFCDDFNVISTPPSHLLSSTPPSQQHQYLTLEELKLAQNSCWLCGCNWQQDHVSLDCPECDGYALTRPCPSCDGKCKQIWRRNISGTHDRHRASWFGQCAFHTGAKSNVESIEAKDAATKLDQLVESNKGALGGGASNGSSKRMPVGRSTSSPQMVVARAIPSSSSYSSSRASSATSSDSEPECQIEIQPLVNVPTLAAEALTKPLVASDQTKQSTKSQQQHAQEQPISKGRHLCACN